MPRSLPRSDGNNRLGSYDVWLVLESAALRLVCSRSLAREGEGVLERLEEMFGVPHHLSAAPWDRHMADSPPNYMKERAFNDDHHVSGYLLQDFVVLGISDQPLAFVYRTR